MTHISEIIQDFLVRLRDGEVCRCEIGSGVRGDSVLEDRFWHMMKKTRQGWHGAADQLQIGRYRVDSAMDCDGKVVVIELDGKSFHDPKQDYIRDTEILKSVDAVIRIPFAAMWYYRYETFKVLGSWFPRFELGYHNDVFSMDELEAECKAVAEDECEPVDQDTHIDRINQDYGVWRAADDIGWVGTPRQFLQTFPKIAIQLRTGHADAGMLDRVYDKAGCRSIQTTRLREVA